MVIEKRLSYIIICCFSHNCYIWNTKRCICSRTSFQNFTRIRAIACPPGRAITVRMHVETFRNVFIEQRNNLTHETNGIGAGDLEGANALQSFDL